jgi:hypothetical protein
MLWRLLPTKLDIYIHSSYIVDKTFTGLDYMLCITEDVSYETGTAYPSRALYGGVPVSQLFSFLCCVFFNCLCSMSCSQCGLRLWIVHSSIHVRFSLTFIFIDTVVCVVLSCVFTFWVPCCDIRYDFDITTVFGSSLPTVVCRMAHVLFTFFCGCLCIVVSNTYCAVFLLCLSSSYVPHVASFSGLSIFDCPLRYSLTFIEID